MVAPFFYVADEMSLSLPPFSLPTDSRKAGGPDRADHPRKAQADFLPERRLWRYCRGRQRRRGGVLGGQMEAKGVWRTRGGECYANNLLTPYVYLHTIPFFRCPGGEAKAAAAAVCRGLFSTQKKRRPFVGGEILCAGSSAMYTACYACLHSAQLSTSTPPPSRRETLRAHRVPLTPFGAR